MVVAESVGAETRPVPVRVIVCGELITSSGIVTEAVNGPWAVGVKCPWMVQLVPAATVVPQLLAKTKEEAFAPVTTIGEMGSDTALLFVRVTDWETLATPTATSPNERLVAESVGAGANPFPLRVIVCGELDASSVMVTVAVSPPSALGVKVP